MAKLVDNSVIYFYAYLMSPKPGKSTPPLNQIERNSSHYSGEQQTVFVPSTPSPNPAYAK